MIASDGEHKAACGLTDQRAVNKYCTGSCATVVFGGKTRRLPGRGLRVWRPRAVRLRVRRALTAARRLQAGAALHSRALDQVGAPELQPVGGGIFEEQKRPRMMCGS